MEHQGEAHSGVAGKDAPPRGLVADTSDVAAVRPHRHPLREPLGRSSSRLKAVRASIPGGTPRRWPACWWPPSGYAIPVYTPLTTAPQCCIVGLCKQHDNSEKS
jgi:hypothetical protein